MKIHIPAFEPMAKCNEHLRHGEIDIDLGDDVVKVVLCKDCRWAREKDHREPTDTSRKLICQCFKHHHIPAPWGARMAVSPDDFCSYGERNQVI